MARKLKAQTPRVSPDEAKRRHDLMDAAIERYSGGADQLEAALGMYMIGRHVGWKALYLIHTKATIAKYEAILGIKVREEFEAETADSQRSMAFNAAVAISNFWKVVSGEEKLALDRDERRSLT